MAKKVLIIEDEQPLVELLVSKLKKEGYEVDFANDGEEGIKKIKKIKPDIILLDIVMPKMDGYEVLEKLNKEEISIPVIIISNSGQPVEIEKTKKLGAVGHLIKTEFNPVDVINMVNECFGSDGCRIKKNNQALVPQENTDTKVKKNGIKVMLVEDDNFLREICSKKLLNKGYTVFEAIDGEEAIEAVAKIKPDIVLLDIILPAIDGFQILNYIKTSKDKELAKTPVLMLSNLGQEDDIKKAFEMGADDYLVKAHFTTEDIVKKINKVLKK